MDKLVTDFKDSLFNSTLKDVAVDVTELGIDSILDNDLLKSLPIAKTLIGIGKFAQNLHDRNLLKQTAIFINTFNNKIIAPEKLEKHIQKLNDNPNFGEEELGRVLILLNSTIDSIKSELLSKFYWAYIHEQLSWDEFCEYADIITRMFISDLPILIDIHKNKITETKQCKHHQVERLVSLGLLNASVSSIMADGKHSITHYYVNTNHLGNIFCNIAMS